MFAVAEEQTEGGAETQYNTHVTPTQERVERIVQLAMPTDATYQPTNPILQTNQHHS